jgi:hypothetical protein
MSEYPDCYESGEVVCKHVRASITAYVDLNDVLPPGVTVTSATVDPADDDLDASAVEVLDEDIVIEQTSTCAGHTLYAGRALSFVLANGTASDEETLVTVCWVQSDGDDDCRDMRLLVGGRA